VQGVRQVNLDDYVAATAKRFRPGHGLSFSGPIALVMVRIGIGTAAWTCLSGYFSVGFPHLRDINTLSFDDRSLGLQLASTYFALPLFDLCRQNRDQTSTSERPARGRNCSFEIGRQPSWRTTRQAPLPSRSQASSGEANLELRTALLRHNLEIARYCRTSDLPPARARLRLYLHPSNGGSLAAGQISPLLATDNSPRFMTFGAHCLHAKRGEA